MNGLISRKFIILGASIKVGAVRILGGAVRSGVIPTPKATTLHAPESERVKVPDFSTPLPPPVPKTYEP